MNPALLLTHNNFDLNKRCIASLGRQNVSTEVYVFDNGSTDGTQDWLRDNIPASRRWVRDTNIGVSKAWNIAIDHIFTTGRAEHVLVVGSDTVLPPWFYASLLSYNTGFVTGTAVNDFAMIASPATPLPLQCAPDFSAFLITYDCWSKIGPFDERFKLYVQDCDMHIRAFRKGINLWKANVPYYHETSSTIRNAPDDERVELENQANLDRDQFRALYGTIPGEPAYDLLLTPDQFGINK